jgi:uncharacterized membrane protein affecting hemolysin expression
MGRSLMLAMLWVLLVTLVSGVLLALLAHRVEMELQSDPAIQLQTMRKGTMEIFGST